MADLTDAIVYVDAIYELAITDKVLGGKLPSGVSNKQAQQLANRTAWLKNELENAQEALRTIHPVGELQCLAAPAYNAADYDADPTSATYGLGLRGTPAEHWALCFGVVPGVADLRGHFLAGLDPASIDYSAPGVTGGADTVTLELRHIPSHSHKVSSGASDNNGSTGNGAAYAKSSSGNSGFDANRGTSAVGGDQPHENRPPFYTVVWRQRVSN